MSREGIVDRTEPPERGQALAAYNAVSQWIEYVESEWQHLAPGETMSGSADETLDPILLDLCNETYITAPRQIYDWLRGEIKAIPASVAHRANQIVTAAYPARPRANAPTTPAPGPPRWPVVAGGRSEGYGSIERRELRRREGEVAGKLRDRVVGSMKRLGGHGGDSLL